MAEKQWLHNYLKTDKFDRLYRTDGILHHGEVYMAYSQNKSEQFLKIAVIDWSKNLVLAQLGVQMNCYPNVIPVDTQENIAVVMEGRYLDLLPVKQEKIAKDLVSQGILGPSLFEIINEESDFIKRVAIHPVLKTPWKV